MITKFLIDGVDRLGKSTLAQTIMDQRGYHLYVHYDRPKVLAYYSSEDDPKYSFQFDSHLGMFRLMGTSIPLILDRTHLSEVVYSPMYRGYPGDYVLDLERTNRGLIVWNEVRLILLTTSNFDIVTDDGRSFDFSRKEEEQAKFIEAFNRSQMPKVIVDVHNGRGGYKTPKEIFDEIVHEPECI